MRRDTEVATGRWAGRGRHANEKDRTHYGIDAAELWTVLSVVRKESAAGPDQAHRSAAGTMAVL